MKYFNEKAETMSRDEMISHQSIKLSDIVRKVYAGVPHYREKMKTAGVEPGDIKSVEDLDKLPFTTVEDLRDHYPFGMFMAPMDQIVRLHASSGTMGKSKIVGYTAHDIEVWSECVARDLASAGIFPGDIMQIAYGYGLFTGGLGFHYGCQKAGITVIPVSSGNTVRQIQMMMDLGATAITCTPSYALYIAETLEKMGYRPEDNRLHAGIFGAEPWSEKMRDEIEQRLGIKAYDSYGLSEVMGPGVAIECSMQDGMHIQEDNFIPEIINPATSECLPDGKTGEIVFTTLTKEGIPVIRYRTHDITSLTREKCGCGRTTARMKKVTGRSDDMLIIRGVNVYPTQIENVLLKVSGTAPYYQIIVDRRNNKDLFEVVVEADPHLAAGGMPDKQRLEAAIDGALHSALGIRATVSIADPGTIARSEGKACRVIDRRTI